MASSVEDRRRGPSAGSDRTQQKSSVARRRFGGRVRTPWELTRIQLGGALLLSAASSWFICQWLSLIPATDTGVQHSLVASLAALGLGYAAFRKTSAYPGVSASFHILPALSATYGATFAALLFLRLDYSRAILLASFVATTCWFYFIYFKLQRLRRLSIGLVPVGNMASLAAIKDVDWITLDLSDDDVPRLDAVVADLRADLGDRWERFLADRAVGGTIVLDRKQIEESLTGRVAIDHLSENNLGSLGPGDMYGRGKRLIDLIAAILALALLMPLLLLVAALIKLDSPGPALFAQKRMGYRGREFTMYKFRSMRDGDVPPGEARSAAVTRDRDDRITRIGRWIRRYRIDELPQILNIVKGEMSWIGPRPEAVALSDWYESELSFYRYRHIVRPGLTGWAQVKQGHVADVDEVRSKLQYDFYYIKNFSVWLDVLIIFGTIRAVVTGAGAR
ncbi:sugar transferase [Sphingomonas sp.]|uniref:sugar transferase n=1 Tax=Sphingomonas sp. TaxID=28214 RepID=UPI003B3A3044